MTASANIFYSCDNCKRLHDGDGHLSRPVLCVPVSRLCFIPDCEAVAEANDAVEARRAEARRKSKSECRKQKVEMGNGECEGRKRKAEMGRSACPPERDDVRRPAAVVTAREFGQHEFQASGAADSQNAKLKEFFLLPQNFGKWFKAVFLEELSGATRMNNRAVDLREVFVEMGLYVDNCMMRDEHTDGVCSYYRLCRIEDAVSLSGEKKNNLINGVAEK